MQMTGGQARWNWKKVLGNRYGDVRLRDCNSDRVIQFVKLTTLLFSYLNIHNIVNGATIFLRAVLHIFPAEYKYRRHFVSRAASRTRSGNRALHGG